MEGKDSPPGADRVGENPVTPEKLPACKGVPGQVVGSLRDTWAGPVRAPRAREVETPSMVAKFAEALPRMRNDTYVAAGREKLEGGGGSEKAKAEVLEDTPALPLSVRVGREEGEALGDTNGVRLGKKEAVGARALSVMEGVGMGLASEEADRGASKVMLVL